MQLSLLSELSGNPNWRFIQWNRSAIFWSWLRWPYIPVWRAQSWFQWGVPLSRKLFSEYPSVPTFNIISYGTRCTAIPPIRQKHFTLTFCKMFFIMPRKLSVQISDRNSLHNLRICLAFRLQAYNKAHFVIQICFKLPNITNNNLSK
jgi:hypothetical protein